ncbi:hypothetical protein C0989_001987 [Termitomyces sp. Mn162]|nr:hypothetical protein C0989_001987 [Termitomyces sp. Mn162]
MLEWCQNKALCALCAWWSEACVFDAPSMGLRCDTSVCLPCHVSYEKCLILLEWQAVCIAAEQGWDEDWVRSQLGKVQKTWVSGEGSTEWSVGQVGPLRGGWREGASSAADHGKWRASSLSEAGLSKRPQGHELMAGPSGFHIYSPTPGRTLRMGVKFSGAPAFDHRGLSSQVGGGANGGIDGMGGGALMGKGGLRRGTGGEGGVRVGAEHLGASGTGASTRGMGLAGASDAVGGAVHRGGGGVGNGTRGLGAGALGSLGWCLCGICIDPGWVGADARGSASGVAAGDGKGGEVAGRALAA